MCTASASPIELVTKLREIGCTIERSPIADYFSVGVPKTVSMEMIDGILSGPTRDERIAVAYPSFRHATELGSD